MRLQRLWLILGIGLAWLPFHEGVAQNYRFDAEEVSFEDGSPYRWVRPPDSTFTRPRLERARPHHLTTGVAGDALAIQLDLPDGTWWLTLWLESGIEDSTTMTLQVNGEPTLLDWHAFNPPAEPRTTIQSIYRMYHGPVSVSGGEARVEMIGGDDAVRLLSMTLTANPGMGDPEIIERIGRLGTYGPHLRLENIMAGEDPDIVALGRDLADLAEADPDDAFAAYWLEQIEILRSVEQNIRLMGWEWATDSTGQGIFDRFHQAVMQLDGLLGRPDAESSPLYERALFQRGRLHHWLFLERGGPSTLRQGRIDLAEVWKLYPDDELLSMYNGKRIATPGACDDLTTGPGAPDWSVLQLEALCRLRSEVHWWVNDRQSETGEFGGKIGDDVELFRWWPPVVLSGDTTAFKGWRRLADGVMVTRKVHLGYSRKAIDVEHASEFIADTAPEMVFYSDDPEYVDRLRYSSDYFNNLWTAHTPSGRRFFKSAWFSSTEIDERPPRNRDLEMNTRAVKAIRYLAWKTGDPDVIGPLHEWSESWRHAAMRTEKGKPAGVIPASVRFPDEAINGDEPTWHEANMFWDYFDWANRGTQMLDQLLFTYTLTADETLLEPMFATLDLIRQHEKSGWPAGGSAEVGSAEWAADALKHRGQFWNTVAQWRFHTGLESNDDLLEEFGTPYARFRMSGDEAHLVDGLNGLLDEIRFNTPLRTTEVLHTDRVRTPGAMHLKAMLTGDGTAEGSSPYYAASWEGTDEGFTALVTAADFGRLDIQVFAHSVNATDRTTPVTLRIWKLEPGMYHLNISGQDSPQTVEIRERGQRVSIPLSANTLTTISFETI